MVASLDVCVAPWGKSKYVNEIENFFHFNEVYLKIPGNVFSSLVIISLFMYEFTFSGEVFELSLRLIASITIALMIS